MTRIRYRISLLFFLTTLVAICCSWVAWPKRTAENFVAEYRANGVSIENPYVKHAPEYAAFEKTISNRLERKRQLFANLKLVPHKRSWTDVLAGRQKFYFGIQELTVCRGTVVSRQREFFFW
jgi:hypothetical protein